MALSNSVIRRYTPPTCTLEVWAQNSPLSRWMGKSVLKQISFELCLDDPQQPEAAKQFLRGNREQLEALYTAVTNYVQEHLQKSSDNFWFNACGAQDSLSETSQKLPTSDEQQTLQQTNHKFTFLNNQIPSGNIHLKPSDNLTHNLFLGSLANQASTPVINLSTLQLFDLANALDEYSTDVVALPNLSEQKVLNFPKWATVAVVLGFAAGLTPLTMQLARNQQKTQTAQEIAADTEEKIYLQPTPSLQLSVSPNPGLASSDSLLPGLSSISPQSPNPSVSTSTLPKYNSAVQVPANPQLGLPTTNLPPQGQVAIPTPGNSAQVPTNKPNSARTRIASSSQNKQPNLNTSTSKINSIISSRKSTFNQPPTPPQTSITRAIINLTSKSPATKDKEKNASNSAVNRLRQGRNLSSQKTATTTLFDTFQVAEARSFITKRWQPPNSLTTALEYSLLVGADGTIERIEPLNKAARDYVDRSGLPLIDFPFCFS